VALPDGAFYHFGTSRELLETTLRLQNLRLDRRQFGPGIREHPATFIQNAQVGVGLHASNHTVWIENAVVPEGWKLTHSHILTGIPANTWRLCLPAGVCLDLVPVGEQDWAVRFYGMDDPFRGPCGEAETIWLGRPAEEWFRCRGLTLAECGVSSTGDIQHAPLFPVLPGDGLDDSFLQWLLGWPQEQGAAARLESLINRPVAVPGPGCEASLQRPVTDAGWGERYRGVPRLSASALAGAANLQRRGQQREGLRQRALERLAASCTHSVFLRTDLAAAAETFARHGLHLPDATVAPMPLDALHLCMFRAAVRRGCGDGGWRRDEGAAFDALRQAFLSPTELVPVLPQRRLLADQIVWGRCPVRLDLAGGWTDTPPYCLIHGGRVVNLAVELNGQPPIQVFGRCTEAPEIVIRSIDLGQELRLRSFDDLRGFAEVGSAFSIPRAALAMAGFLPEFSLQPADSLRQALERFGGGIDLALVAAVPKGSGLGTSSILAATVLGTLAELCGLGWDREHLVRRTLCLEQMLTTGGGWQDQAGGIYPGLKLLESAPGSPQVVRVRWLPDMILRQQANQTVLLYYTGITRVAKAILQEVVRSMFLNAGQSLGLLSRLAENAARAADAAQRQNLPALGAAVQHNGELNCALDAGTNPPAIQALLARTQRWLDGAKLLGAGGGGYLLMVAKDPAAAVRVRQELAAQPPTEVARFVDLAVSDSGLQITRS
jgi:galactokinase/mevalonate kinase-like predicted kinase